MILNTGSRLPMYIHTRTYRLPWVNALRPDHPAVDLHPEDAKAHGLVQGSKVRIVTPHNAVTVSVNLTLMAQQGVVHLYHGHPSQDANSLIPWDYKDPISGYPGYKGYICRLEPVKED